MRCPEPEQLSLADEIEDEMTFGEWMESLPLDPWESEVAEANVWNRRCNRDWPEKRAA